MLARGHGLLAAAKKAAAAAGIKKEVTAVSRFTDRAAEEFLDSHGIRRICCDLLDEAQFDSLPDAENVIFMAGRKFGTDGGESETWAMNAALPAYAARKYKNANTVVFSSGNVYPMTGASSGGCDEDCAPGPAGEYAMSCLARERIFEYASLRSGTKVLLLRLNYAVDLRYGVLYDIADKIMKNLPVSLSVPCFNCVWQGYANEAAIRGLLHTGSPAVKINITGPETVSVRQTALKLGEYLGIKPVFADDSERSAFTADALLSNSSRAMEMFGYPSVSINKLIRWQAEWIADGGRALGKPTHFEERGGKY